MLLPLLKKTAEEPGSDVRIVTVSNIPLPADARLTSYSAFFPQLSSGSHYESWVDLDWKSFDQWTLANDNVFNAYTAYRERTSIPLIFLPLPVTIPSTTPLCRNDQGPQCHALQGASAQIGRGSSADLIHRG